MKINNIYLGDAYLLIKDIPDKSIDLIITDPPYKYTTGGGSGCFGKKNKSYHDEYMKVSKNTYRQDLYKQKNRDEINHLSFGIDYSILDDFVRVMKKINIYMFLSKHMIQTILNYFLDKGCNYEIMFWGKTNPLPTCNNTYLNDIEYLLFFRDKNVKIEGNYESKSKFYISGSNYYDKKYWSHPTIKPLRMVKNLIINSSAEGDLILDPFIGSGTTALACKDLKRNYVGFEIDEEYYKIANERIKDFTTDSSVNVNTSAMSIYDFGIEV